ncbi:MAG: class II glutamine amidotransferase [Clostridia bacterium]|nr:class II glutamine amidotransferase [Clostridia bacterium]
MCMLFAVSSPGELTINNYLKSFYAFSDKHPHGWGLACVDTNNITVEKESISAGKSNFLKERLSEPIETKLLLAHIRYATIGNIEHKNCHPFRGKDNRLRHWVLIHNGTIFDYPPLSKYTKIQKGDTDSERIFLYLLDKINERQTDSRLAFDERFDLIESIVRDMAPNNKLNLIFTDGKYLYVHTNCRDTLYYLEKDGSTFFCTAPITNENWKKLPFCTLLAYKNGKLFREGAPHTGEYIESPENIKLLYQIFSNL